MKLRFLSASLVALFVVTGCSNADIDEDTTPESASVDDVDETPEGDEGQVGSVSQAATSCTSTGKKICSGGGYYEVRRCCGNNGTQGMCWTDYKYLGLCIVLPR